MSACVLGCKASRASEWVATVAARKTDIFLAKYMYNISPNMRRHTLTIVCVLCALILGCASEPETEGARLPSRSRQRGSARATAAGDDQAMDMQMSIGVLDERTVDRAMAPHVPALVDCFERAGDARKYLSGQVVLRFVVEATGSVSDIHVIKNELGSYPVERCLIDAGRRIAFPRPEGNRKTDFEYSLRFRSTGEMRVLDWRGDNVAIRVASTNDFSTCGTLGPLQVEAIAYVEPAGTIGSVGFVSQGPINPVAASCAEEQMLKLRISDSRPNVVLRTVFPLIIVAQRTSKADLSHRPSKPSRHP